MRSCHVILPVVKLKLIATEFLLYLPFRFSSLAVSPSARFTFRYSIVLRRMASQLPAGCSVIRGQFESLPAKVQDYVADKVELCQPDNVYICDGSKEENESLINQLIESGVLTKLTKYDNWYVELVAPEFHLLFDIFCQKCCATESGVA